MRFQQFLSFLRMAFLLENWKNLAREQQNMPRGMSAIRRKQSLPILGPPRTCSCRTPQKLLAGPKFDLQRPWLSWKKSASGDSETDNRAKTLLGGLFQASGRGLPTQSSDMPNARPGKRPMECLLGRRK